uniref:Uncharacterized protein n=1 Tax=Micrurus lemniscatus lemniscatus TaxID=129467 RepID=A0A2D4HGP0_MICLE
MDIRGFLKDPPKKRKGNVMGYGYSKLNLSVNSLKYCANCFFLLGNGGKKPYIPITGMMRTFSIKKKSHFSLRSSFESLGTEFGRRTSTPRRQTEQGTLEISLAIYGSCSPGEGYAHKEAESLLAQLRGCRSVCTQDRKSPQAMNGGGAGGYVQ